MIYQITTSIFDSYLFPPPGKMIEIDNYDMHLYCTGPENNTFTIILNSGWKDFSLTWTDIQKELSKKYRVCSYDRFGYGWSENKPRNGKLEQPVEELELLLDASNESTPLILIGNSLGAAQLQLYSTRNPRKILGLVLEDSILPISKEEECDLILSKNNTLKCPKEKSQNLFIQKIALHTGITRFFNMIEGTCPFIPKDAQPACLSRIYIPSRIDGSKELDFDTWMKDDTILKKSINNTDDIPLIIISGQQPWSISKTELKNMDDDEIAFNIERLHLKNQIYEGWASHSAYGKVIKANESGHLIHFTEPDMIIDAIEEIIK
jgi:pimeloyl-ACP methyl ester carboxylesterase